jgi:hypothetical protein
VTTRTEELGPLLYQALAEPIGLLLRVSEPQKVMQALHQVKYKAGDPSLMILQIRMLDHPEGNIAITKSDKDLPLPGGL